MGTWGTESFANDDALDWAASLVEARDHALVQRTLAAVADAPEGEYLQAPECCEALAAAEVVAALRGRPATDLPDEIAAWLAAAHPTAEPSLVNLAQRAVDAVAGGAGHRSELQDP